MNTDFSNLRFKHAERRIPGRLIWMGGLLVAVGLAWVTLPPASFFWLILLLVAALGWAASYGWRQSIQVLVTFLDLSQSL